MQSARAIEILQRQRQEIAGLVNKPSDSPDFYKWKRDTVTAIENIFPHKKGNVSDFQNVRYVSMVTFTGDDRDVHQVFVNGLKKADAVLASMIDEIRDFPFPSEEVDDAVPDALPLIERICLRFQAAAQHLQDRHGDRPSLEINDEYDVQDLLYAFLRLHFDDIRKEECTPSYAGTNSRVDFFLRQERVLIEVKKTRSGLKAKEVGEQLIVDCARYETRTDCDTLVCFVYDPERRIANPAGIQHDLEKGKGRLKVRVIIAPQ